MKTNEVKITRAQLIEMLLTWSWGAQPASVQYVTEPKINKEGKSRFGIITKLAAVGCIINYDFEKSVNEQLKREGKEPNFKAKSLWNGKGEHINRQLVRHVETEALYLAYKYQQTFKSFHFDNALNFIPVSLIRQFFYSSTPTNQGVEEGNEITPRTLKIENIRKLKVRKVTYVVVG